MKTAFVTGAGGFLGLNLVKLLLENRWKIKAFDLNVSKLRQFDSSRLQSVKGDITDSASCEEAMPDNVDAVFHLAGDTTHWKPGNTRQTLINVDGTRIMVETAIKKRARRFIFTSSIGAYGAHSDTITEESPSTALDSIINYWRTKRFAEQKVRQGIERGLDAVILNPANIIGPHDDSGWSRLFFLIEKGKLAGAPPGSASFCHAGEVARAHMLAFEKGRSGHNYLLGGSDGTWLEFVQQIGRLLGRKVPDKPLPAFILKSIGRISLWISYLTRKEPDITPEKAYLVSTKLICNSDKARKELGYRVVSLEAMLEDCHQWLVTAGLL